MRVVVAIVVLTIAVGCEAPRWHNDQRLVSDWSFQPPRGWNEVGDQAWRTSNPPQRISLQIIPAGHPVNLRSISDPYGMTMTRITICHGLAALFEVRRPWFFGSNVEEIVTQKSGSIAVASYYYAHFYEADAGAESSIRSICPRTR